MVLYVAMVLVLVVVEGSLMKTPPRPFSPSWGSRRPQKRSSRFAHPHQKQKKDTSRAAFHNLQEAARDIHPSYQSINQSIDHYSLEITRDGTTVLLFSNTVQKLPE